MYICPVCNKGFEEDESLFVKHYLKCWVEHNPLHKPKPAPRSEDINTREDSDEVMNFFGQFQRKE